MVECMPTERRCGQRPKVCFLGGTRYDRPLDHTQEKKWRLLTEWGEIFVIGFSDDWKPRCFAQHARFYLLPKLPVPVLRYLLMFGVGPVLALWTIFRHGVTVLVGQSPYEGSAAALAKRVAGLLGRRTALIVESHGDFEGSLFLQRRVLYPALYRFFMRRTARFSLEDADLLRAVSDSTRKQLERWTRGKALVQFPTWTDLDLFLAAGAWEMARRPGLILYAGVLIPLKGVHHLLNAFGSLAAQFPSARLVLAGTADDPAYAAELKEQVRRLGVDGEVEFSGPLPQSELACRMREAAVVVLPSFSEGLPRVVFEGMAAGAPIIASRVGGIPEMVEDGVTGFLIRVGDEETLAERLR